MGSVVLFGKGLERDLGQDVEQGFQRARSQVIQSFVTAIFTTIQLSAIETAQIIVTTALIVVVAIVVGLNHVARPKTAISRKHRRGI